MDWWRPSPKFDFQGGDVQICQITCLKQPMLAASGLPAGKLVTIAKMIENRLPFLGIRLHINKP